MTNSNEHSAYLELDHDVRIEPIYAGGFIVSQGYYLEGRTDGEGNKQYVQFKKAFSSAGDLLSFLSEAFNYPYMRKVSQLPVNPVNPT